MDVLLGVAVDGANRHDMTRAEATMEAIMITRPEPMATQPQHLGLATGDDDAAVCETLEAWGYTAHMRRGEAVQAKRDISGYRGAALGGGAHTGLDAPLSAVAHPRREEGGELSRTAAFRVRLDHLLGR
jgi:hypothetical protein